MNVSVNTQFSSTRRHNILPPELSIETFFIPRVSSLHTVPNLKFTSALNSALFWKRLVLEIVLGTSDTSRCSVSAPQVQIVPLLDALQLLVFAETLRYLEPKTFFLNHIL
jgi:hypothetical protein